MMATARRLARPLGGIWLVVLLVGALHFGWTDPAILIFAALGACGVVGFLLWPNVRARRSGHPARNPVLALHPDPRKSSRAPKDGPGLLRRLADAKIGTATPEAGGLRVRSPEGDWIRLCWPAAEGATSANLRIDGSSEALALAVCDALAPMLGPFALEVDGVEIFLDGTTPKEALERELWNRRMAHLQALERDRASGG